LENVFILKGLAHAAKFMSAMPPARLFNQGQKAPQRHLAQTYINYTARVKCALLRAHSSRMV